ncbi:MAG: archaemetzincin family Zn-dependent metalloprotease [Deltaproteobacteria bacterium]|nr:archaemetzincin family Zn-dependent metalloprotease [Deltaproteobacteria bacterium]
MITLFPHNIIITPIGKLHALGLDPIRNGIQEIFQCNTEVLDLLTDIEFAFDPNRDQYHSTTILEKLADLAPVRAHKILAVCHVDLFIPILTHVYGEAQLGGKACIISTFRLEQDLPPMNPQKKFEQRIIKEAIHELGHTFDLRHCKDKTCAMHYCRTIHDVDGKSAQLCRYCKTLLEDEKKRLRGIRTY